MQAKLQSCIKLV